MDRLTKPNGDYCRDVCGQANTCERLEYAKRHPGTRCQDAKRYERLRQYENTGLTPDEIKDMKEDMA